MTITLIIQNLINDNLVEQELRQGLITNQSVKSLQTILFQLGFGQLLKWDIYGADGKYGPCTIHAVQQFSIQNNIVSNGQHISEDLAKLLLQRYAILDELWHLHDTIEKEKTEEWFNEQSDNRVAIATLQTLLHELNFDKELAWKSFGADGLYGPNTKQAVQSFANHQRIYSDGKKLTPQLAQLLLNKFTPFYGIDWNNTVTSSRSTRKNLSIHEKTENNKLRIYVSNDKKRVRFTRFRKGVYQFGHQSVSSWIEKNISILRDININNADINIMKAVAKNEGNFDAINTWDNSYLSFGLFQWTLGSSNHAGELPALLQLIKQSNIVVFQHYFTHYGLDIIDTTEKIGYVTLNGKKLSTAKEKETLRSYEWAFYFWLAGQDITIQTCQIIHAINRIPQFYNIGFKINNIPITELITSEYGVTLLLDHHVNRPGHVSSVLSQALAKITQKDPTNWTTSDEQQYVELYLGIREKYGNTPMTNSKKRGNAIKHYLSEGIISNTRGSYNNKSTNNDTWPTQIKME